MTPDTIQIPPVIRDAIAAGGILSISVSGGKDSQAMLRALLHEAPPANLHEIVHADLGRAEWPQTPGHMRKLARDAALPMAVVQRAKGDLVQRIEERLTQVSTLTGEPPAKPFWPSAAQRYCTSDLKRDPIHKHQRTHGANQLIISCQGMRAEESSRRAEKPVVAVDNRISSKHYKQLTPEAAMQKWNGEGRLVLNWLPIHTWPVELVWNWLGSTTADVDRRRALHKAGEVVEALVGWEGHPAYVFGNERLSCALCVLASENDLCNGKKHHPWLYQRYVELEQQSGFTFKNGFSLASLETAE